MIALSVQINKVMNYKHIHKRDSNSVREPILSRDQVFSGIQNINPAFKEKSLRKTFQSP